MLRLFSSISSLCVQRRASNAVLFNSDAVRTSLSLPLASTADAQRSLPLTTRHSPLAGQHTLASPR
jgi:hypothetical protein